jgi:bacterial mobilization protein MobC
MKREHIYCPASTEFVHSHKFECGISQTQEGRKVMRKREIKLSVYLNDNEWRMLTLKAEKVGYNKSALVRSLIEGFEPKEKPSEEFYEDLNSIRKVGNVLNQIARRAHYQGYIEDEKFLRKMENELQNLILNIKRKYLLPEEK